MNKIQRVILILTAAILILMLLFPPFYAIQGSLKVTKGYGFILNPPGKWTYWNKHAEEQAALDFERDIIADPRYSELPLYKQEEVEKFYFEEEKAKYPIKRTDRWIPLVDIYQLIAQCIIVVFAGGILWFALKTKD
ncbi:MAG: hypothetical protein DRP37_02215 [Thermodesulfobacteriota bacterium]|nr:MAG: hypothetical protein DRP37_02215 [Thermodesulfobacteriota bacterium]